MMVTNEWHSFFKTFVIGYVDIPESRTSNHLQLWQYFMIHSWNKYSMFSGQKGNKIRFVIKSEKMDWVSYWWYSTEDPNSQKEVKSPYVDDQVSWGTWLLQPAPKMPCHGSIFRSQGRILRKMISPLSYPQLPGSLHVSLHITTVSASMLTIFADKTFCFLCSLAVNFCLHKPSENSGSIFFVFRSILSLAVFVCLANLISTMLLPFLNIFFTSSPPASIQTSAATF